MASGADRPEPLGSILGDRPADPRRRRGDLSLRPRRRHPPARQHEDDGVRLRRFRLPVCDVHHRDPAGSKRFEQSHDLRAPWGIDHCGRLVGDEQPWLPGQRGRDREPLQLAPGQARRLALLEAGKPHPGEQSAHVPGRRRGSPQITSSLACTPSTWLSGLWKIIAVPCGTPRPGSPARRTVPSVGDKRPASRRTSVDFPEPFGPTSARNDFGSTLSETSATAQLKLPGYW